MIRRADKLAILVAVLSGITAAVAIAALVIALTGQAKQINRAAKNSCVLLRGLVLSAAASGPHATLASRQAAARAYIKATPLRDCDAYASSVVHPVHLQLTTTRPIP